MKVQFFTIVSILTLTIAEGAVHTFSFNGTVNSVALNENNTLGIISSGDAFSGTISYSDFLDNNPSESVGTYWGNSSLSLELGDSQINYTNKTIAFHVENNLTEHDSFITTIDGSCDDWSLTTCGFELIDNSQTVFTDDSLPTAFSISDFDISTFHLTGSKYSSGDNFSLTMTVQDISPIPEPATAIISLLGGGLLLFFRRLRL